MKRFTSISSIVLFFLISALPWSVRAQNGSSPTLSIQSLDPDTVALSWSNGPPGFVLQGIDSLTESRLWTGILQPPIALGNLLTVTQNVSGLAPSMKFFRLVSKGSPAARDYLLASQNPDGTWGDPNRTLFRDTAGAVETLALFSPVNSAFAGGLSALTLLSPRNNDDLARKTIALASGGQDVSATTALLLASQNGELFSSTSRDYPGRGWGLASSYGNCTLDTALALRALKASGRFGGLSVVRETMPVSGTSPPHAFQVPAGASSLFLKVRSVQDAAVRFHLTDPNSASSFVDTPPGTATLNIGPISIVPGQWTLAVENRGSSPATYSAEIGFDGPDGFSIFRLSTALMYLGSAQNVDGGWGTAPDEDSHLMITAETLRALAVFGSAFPSQQVLQRGASWLLAHQNPDGGFSSESATSNPYDTALAVQALRLASPSTSLASAATYLKNDQRSDGSWANDPYQTALAIQALVLPPVISPFPGQTVTATNPFAPVYLDGYVTDPDNADPELSWMVTGAARLMVAISNHVATIHYPEGTPGSTISELLTFTVTDPDGHFSSTTTTFSVIFAAPQTPVVSGIPDQSVLAPDPFAPLSLDSYVFDPDTSDADINWNVTGNLQLSVSISNRVARITYPALTNATISERLTFVATDPTGLSASNSALFTVSFVSVDYTIARGGRVDDFRLIGASPAVWDQADSVEYTYTSPSWLAYTNTALSLISDTDLRVDYEISVGTNATTGVTQLQVPHRVLDVNMNELGPLTNNVFNFRIRVTP